MTAHLCACGCGQETNLIRSTNTPRGEVKGEHYRYVSGHCGPSPRLPFAPCNVGPNIKALARRLGVDRNYIYRWLSHGVTIDRAEWLADRLGRHPTELWDNYYEMCS